MENALFINIEKNIWFPILIIITLFLGVYITQYVHLSESAGHATSAQQNVMVMGCIIENIQDCQTKANTLNSDAYTKLQAGTIQTGDFYIAFSLQNSMLNNAFTYFCGAIMLVWAIVFGSSLQVKK